MRRVAGRPLLPAGWVEPAAGGPEPAVVGNLDSGWRPTVDHRGLLRPTARWGLDWWVGGSDRWHVPSREKPTAVSQRLVDGTPVVETALRVPGGQAVHRVWCVRAGADEWAVVEVENRSREPFAVALAVRPLAGRGVRRLERDGGVVRVDGDALVLDRRPAHLALSDGAADVADVVLASAAGPAAPDGVGSRAGLAHAALVFPLAHTAVLRAAVRVGAASLVAVDALPGHEAVARGWAAHLDAAVRAELPGADLVALVRACRTAALLQPGPAVLGGLDRWGHDAAAADAFAAALAARRPFTLREAAAVGRHALLAGDAAALEPVLVALARAVHDHGGDGGRDAEVVADALDLAGQGEAAAACRTLAGGGRPPAPGADLDELVASASAVGTWAAGSLGRAGAVLDLAGRLLVDDSRAGVEVAPGWPAAWRGQPAEVHGAPTRHGPVSWALRWHGARPALLWEGAGAPLTAPALDPSWTSAAAVGEALLAPLEPAGGLPGVVAPLTGERTPAAEVDDPGAGGVSFT